MVHQYENSILDKFSLTMTKVQAKMPEVSEMKSPESKIESPRVLVSR